MSAPSALDRDAYARIVEHAADAVVVVDRDGRVAFANPAAVALFGHDLVGQEFGYPLATDRRAEIDVIARGEHRVAELRVTQVPWEGQEGQLVLLRDVTDRARTEQAMRDFVSMVSHELHQPLAVCRTLVGLLDVDEQDPSQVETIGTLKRQMDSMTETVEQLLMLSRADAGQLRDGHQEVRVDQVLRDVAAESEDLQLETEDGLVIQGQIELLRRAIDNLVSNARKYGGPPIVLEGDREDGAVLVRVCDQGDGVPEEFLPRLFERFQRAEQGGQGTGLGLALVRKLAEAMDGTCFHQRNRPSGAIFTLRFPAA